MKKIFLKIFLVAAALAVAVNAASVSRYMCKQDTPYTPYWFGVLDQDVAQVTDHFGNLITIVCEAITYEENFFCATLDSKNNEIVLTQSETDVSGGDTYCSKDWYTEVSAYMPGNSGVFDPYGGIYEKIKQFMQTTKKIRLGSDIDFGGGSIVNDVAECNRPFFPLLSDDVESIEGKKDGKQYTIKNLCYNDLSKKGAGFVIDSTQNNVGAQVAFKNVAFENAWISSATNAGVVSNEWYDVMQNVSIKNAEVIASTAGAVVGLIANPAGTGSVVEAMMTGVNVEGTRVYGTDNVGGFVGSIVGTGFAINRSKFVGDVEMEASMSSPVGGAIGSIISSAIYGNVSINGIVVEGKIVKRQGVNANPSAMGGMVGSVDAGSFEVSIRNTYSRAELADSNSASTGVGFVVGGITAAGNATVIGNLHEGTTYKNATRWAGSSSGATKLKAVANYRMSDGLSANVNLNGFWSKNDNELVGFLSAEDMSSAVLAGVLNYFGKDSCVSKVNGKIEYSYCWTKDGSQLRLVEPDDELKPIIPAIFDYSDASAFMTTAERQSYTNTVLFTDNQGKWNDSELETVVGLGEKYYWGYTGLNSEREVLPNTVAALKTLQVPAVYMQKPVMEFDVGYRIAGDLLDASNTAGILFLTAPVYKVNTSDSYLPMAPVIYDLRSVENLEAVRFRLCSNDATSGSGYECGSGTHVFQGVGSMGDLADIAAQDVAYDLGKGNDVPPNLRLEIEYEVMQSGTISVYNEEPDDIQLIAQGYDYYGSSSSGAVELPASTSSMFPGTPTRYDLKLKKTGYRAQNWRVELNVSTSNNPSQNPVEEFAGTPGGLASKDDILAALWNADKGMNDRLFISYSDFIAFDSIVAALEEFNPDPRGIHFLDGVYINLKVENEEKIPYKFIADFGSYFYEPFLASDLNAALDYETPLAYKAVLEMADASGNTSSKFPAAYMVKDGFVCTSKISGYDYAVYPTSQKATYTYTGYLNKDFLESPGLETGVDKSGDDYVKGFYEWDENNCTDDKVYYVTLASSLNGKDIKDVPVSASLWQPYNEVDSISHGFVFGASAPYIHVPAEGLDWMFAFKLRSIVSSGYQLDSITVTGDQGACSSEHQNDNTYACLWKFKIGGGDTTMVFAPFAAAQNSPNYDKSVTLKYNLSDVPYKFNFVHPGGAFIDEPINTFLLAEYEGNNWSDTLTYVRSSPEKWSLPLMLTTGGCVQWRGIIPGQNDMPLSSLTFTPQMFDFFPAGVTQVYAKYFEYVPDPKTPTCDWLNNFYTLSGGNTPVQQRDSVKITVHTDGHGVLRANQYIGKDSISQRFTSVDGSDTLFQMYVPKVKDTVSNSTGYFMIPLTIHANADDHYALNTDKFYYTVKGVDGSTMIGDGVKLAVGEADVDLYVSFEYSGPYYVSYNLNMESANYENLFIPADAVKNDSVPARSPYPMWVPFRSDSCFAGWSTDADGVSGTMKTMDAKAVSAMSPDEMTPTSLYAIWSDPANCNVSMATIFKTGKEAELSVYQIFDGDTIRHTVDGAGLQIGVNDKGYNFFIDVLPGNSFMPVDVAVKGNKSISANSDGSFLIGASDIEYSVSWDLAYVPPIVFEKAVFSKTGRAIRVEYALDKFEKAHSNVAVLARLEREGNGDSVYVLADSVPPGFASTWTLFPLRAGSYKLQISAKDAWSVSDTTMEFSITSESFDVQMGQWQIISLAELDTTDVDEDDDQLFYWWDESGVGGEYWQYRTFKSGDDIIRERGYWYSSLEGRKLTFVNDDYYDDIVWSLDSVYSGWNMVANPYGWSVDIFGDKSAKDKKSDVAFWRYDPASGGYEPATTLAPYEGVWAQVNHPMEWVVPVSPVFDDSSKAGLQKAALAKAKDNWSIRLKLADADGKSDNWNVLGVDDSPRFLAEPPEGMGDHVNLSIVEEGKFLAKSVKPAKPEMEWTVELSASSNRAGFMSVEGVDALRAFGLKVFVTVGGKTTEMREGEPLKVNLAKSAKTATVRVAEAAKIDLVYSLEGLRALQSAQGLKVSFYAGNGLSGAGVRVDVLDLSGRIVASANGKALVGENTLMLDMPKAGLYMLRVRAGGKQASGKVAIR